MIKNILLQHKYERDQLLLNPYIERLNEDEKSKLLKTNLIKVITGPRRTGKSVCGILLLKNTNFAYVNFDDDNLLRNYNEDEITEAIHQVYHGFQFIFFDEIQNVKNWELLVNKLYRRGNNIVVTGSNARLLSKELATSLTGRYIAIEIFPFSFKEFCTINNVNLNEPDLVPEQNGKILSLAFEYLNQGGYPECIANPDIRNIYLSTLFDSIIYKDIVKRFNIRNITQINDLALYLLTNYTNLYSFNSLRSELNFNSVASVQKYIHFLEEPFLFFSLPRFSYKMSTQNKSARKSCIIDNGFIKARSFDFSPNFGRLLENLVCIELMRRGHKPGIELFYYVTRNNLEIDFIIKKGLIAQSLIQVAYDISSQKTLKRELNALKIAGHELKVKKLILVTWDVEKKYSEESLLVDIVPFWKFTSKNLW